MPKKLNLAVCTIEKASALAAPFHYWHELVVSQ